MITEQTIPLSQLVHSDANVRRTGRSDGIAGLAASIAAHGLRQNLNVQPSADGKRFEVVAGARRLRALKLLAKEGKLSRSAPVLCCVLAEGDDPAEISLAENAMRMSMHPDDQCDAFRALIDDKSLSVEDVAARFGVAPTLVRQRLRLAGIAPSLRTLYRKGKLTLDHMMALAISDDHTAQEAAWRNLPDWNRTPQALKRSLTQDTVPMTDKLARLAGVEAYEAAGGVVLRDLFDAEAGYLLDRPLVERLAAERMAEKVGIVQAEGWKWVEPCLSRDYSISHGKVFPTRDEDGTPSYAADDLARAGALIVLEPDGTLSVERGLVHPSDKEKPAKASSEASGGLSAAVVTELTAHRTAALRIELARNPGVALAAAVHAIALPLLYPYGERSCLALRATSEELTRHTKHPEDGLAHRAMTAEGEQWGERLPGESADFFPWCMSQPQDTLLDLLAYAVSLTVDAVGPHQAGPRRNDYVEQLAGALGLDMRQWWSPSIEGFFGRLSKAALTKVIADSGVPPLGYGFGAMTKAEAARVTHRALAESDWLPEPLRQKDSAESLDASR